MLTYEELKSIKEEIKAEIDALVSEEVEIKKKLAPVQKQLLDLRTTKDAENIPNNRGIDRLLKKLKLKSLTTYEKIKLLEPKEEELEEQLEFLNIEINDLQNELLDLYRPEKEDDSENTG